MIRNLLLSILVFSGIALFAQERIYIHRSDHVSVGALISTTDSMYFNSTGSQVYFRIGDNIIQYTTESVDSISFSENTNTITVNYNGATAYVVNPLAFEGVLVTVNGADVTIITTTETKDIDYRLSGSTTDGSFKVYSEKRFNILMNGVNITNQDGPALNIQADNKVSVTLVDGTVNNLADGNIYSAPSTDSDGISEDQKAAFFSEGKLLFSGNGSLTINGNGADKHALCSDDEIQIDGGNITVTGTVKDGIHGKKGVSVIGGTVNVTSSGDGIDGDEGYILVSGGTTTVNCAGEDASGFRCDSTLTISGGTVFVNMSGNQSKGLKSNQPMTLSGGDITIKTTGGVGLETLGSGFNPAYCTAIKGDSTSVTLSGANVTITSSGIAGKGISTGGDITVIGGTINITTTGGGATYKNSTGTTDAYNATCITADGNINILSGSVTTSSSGSGGKGISANGTLTFGDNSNSPIVNITTSGAKITISGSTNTGGDPGWGGGPGGSTGSYDEAKAIKCNGAIIVNNGTLTISSADDGIKSDASITINNGTVSITKSVEAMESPAITIKNGNVSIVASDDGFNATMGLTAGGTEQDDGSSLTINGGTISVSTTTGDGLDSNGNLDITGGTIIVQGPNSAPEVGMDINGASNVSGGLLIVSGPNSGNMIEGVSSSSSQYSILATSTSIGTNLFHVQDASGNNLATFKPVRSCYYVLFSSPDLKNGSTYSIFTGGSSTGTNTNGLYVGGTYSGGTQKKSFKISGIVTNVSF